MTESMIGPPGSDDELEAGAVEPDDASGLPRGVRSFVEWVVVVGVALAIALLVRTFLIGHYEVEGQSMATTLTSGDRVFVNKLSYRLHDPGRGDVVVLHQLAIDEEPDLIKRVIALPGETIEMKNCIVTIDGVVLDEPYLDPDMVGPERCGKAVRPLLVPEGEVFVMGDNRGFSKDSRDIGTVRFDHLVGRAFVVFWPLGRAHWI